MKKSTKEFLEQNGFVLKNMFYNKLYNPVYRQCFQREYTSFKISFYLVPHLYLNPRYNKDYVYYKMRDVEISYNTHTPESLFYLQPDARFCSEIRKLRELHKKYCPLICKGNWKHLSIKQLEKLLKEFDSFDKSIILALKKKRVKTKVADIEKDF